MKTNLMKYTKIRIVIIKKLFLLCIVFCILIGISGCMKKSVNKEEIIEQYNQKYDDKFTYLSGGYELWNDHYDEFFVTSEKLGGAAINVRVYESGKILDNYIEVKYKKEVEKRIGELAEIIYGDHVVINCPPSFGTGKFSKNTTFEEYISSEYANISIAILVNKNSETVEADIRALGKLLADSKILTEIRVYYFDISSVNDVKVLDEKFLEFYPEAYLSIVMSMNSDYSIKSIKLR